MGYSPVYRKVTGLKEEPIVKMILKNPNNLLQQDHKTKLAKVLVDLVLFDFELTTLQDCIFGMRQSRPGLNYTIMDAWKARKNTSGGVECAINYLHHHPPNDSQDTWKARQTASGETEAASGYRNRNPPANYVTEPPKITSGRNNPAVGHFRQNVPADNVMEQLRNSSGGAQAVIGYAHDNPPANDVVEQPFDPSTLPPPDLGDTDEFGSVQQHTNPSSHIDDDANQLIKDSTQLGYRNPPEAKPQGITGNSQSMGDPAGYPPVIEGYIPPDWLPAVTSSSTTPVDTSSNRDHEVSNAPVLGQGQHINVRLGNQSQYGNFRSPNVAAISGNTVTTGGPHSQAPLPSSSSAAASSNRGHKIDKTHPEESSTSTYSQGQYANTHLGNELQYGNAAITGAPHSLPSVPKSIPPTDGSDTSTQLGSLPHRKLYKQKSVPNDGSLSGNMTAVATGPTNSNQLAASDNSPVIAVVPLTGQPTPEASQAPLTADSKYGKTNLNYLKDRLHQKKVVTQTVVQTGGVSSHPQSTDPYVNYEIPFQGLPDSTNKPNVDLTSLRSKLEKTIEEREKAVVASANKKKERDYYNLLDVSTYLPENPVMLNNPADKKPAAGPRTKPPANLASSTTHPASSKKTYRQWQCAQCQKVSETQHASCKYCKLPRGKMASRSILCDFCQLMIFVPTATGELLDVCCPRCKTVYESAC